MIVWTMKRIDETDDLVFAWEVIRERRKGLERGSALDKKCEKAEQTLIAIWDATRKYLNETAQIVVCDSTDLSSCDAETKARILENDARLKEREAGENARV